MMYLVAQMLILQEVHHKVTIPMINYVLGKLTNTLQHGLYYHGYHNGRPYD